MDGEVVEGEVGEEVAVLATEGAVEEAVEEAVEAADEAETEDLDEHPIGSEVI